MKYLLDTNICIYLIKKQYPEIISRLLRVGFDKIGISTITIAELEYGVANSNHFMEAHAALLEFILPFEILDFNYGAASFYGKIRKELKDKGQPISDMDMEELQLRIIGGMGDLFEGGSVQLSDNGDMVFYMHAEQ